MGAWQVLRTASARPRRSTPRLHCCRRKRGVCARREFDPYLFVRVIVSITQPRPVQSDSGAHLIRRIQMSSANVTTLAGSAGLSGQSNGLGAAARFNVPWGIEISPQSTFAVVADSSNHLVRRVSLP